MKSLIRRSYLFFVVILVSFFSSCNNYNPAEQIVFIDNGKIQLGFNSTTGEFLFFQDLINSHEYIDTTNMPGTFWEIDILRSSEVETIDLTSASEFHLSKPDALTLLFTWEGFSGIMNKDLSVTSTITLDKDKPQSSWKISINGMEGNKVSRVVFPKIAGIKDLGDEYLAVPRWMGQIVKDPRSHLSEKGQNKRKYEWYYPGHLSMQCMTLYNENKCGLYAFCNDSLAYRKDLSFALDTMDNSLTYQMNNYPALDSTLDSYTPPYEAIIGSFKGDWITVAELYRDWGSKQRWSTESRFRKDLTPSWLTETALWEWNRGKSDNVLLPATNLKQRLGLPVNVYWSWWHGCLYDDGFPEYLPPRQGRESFIKALDKSKEDGIRAIVYMNAFQWGTSTESWKNKNASLYAVKDINQKPKSFVYNIFTGNSLTNMCMATSFWKDTYAALCDSVVNQYHTSGVYMDQACLSRICYDKNHGHSIGGGNYWVKNLGMLTEQIRSSFQPMDHSILAGEGGGEAWMPYLDLFLTLQVSRERYAGVDEWETIPFFQAVYHQYAITYGNYSSLLIPPYDELWPKEFAPANPLKLLSENYNKQFLMEQARSFVWGMQPTIANYQDLLASERKEEIDYLLNLARVRYGGLKYLLYGQFLRSPDMEIPEEEIGISKLSIYAGQTGESVTSFQKKFPLIYSGTWKSDDNQIGIALASISDNPFHVNFSFNSNDYGLPTSGHIYMIDMEGKKKLGEYSDGIVKIDFILQSKGLCIVEIAANNSLL